jgi:hypothetical protein
MNSGRKIKFLPETDSVKLLLIVILHWIVALGNLSAFFILATQGFTPNWGVSWYEALPMCTFIAIITYSRVIDCPMTRAENKLRKKLGKEQIGGFIKHYFIKPYARRRRQQKQKRK